MSVLATQDLVALAQQAQVEDSLQDLAADFRRAPVAVYRLVLAEDYQQDQVAVYQQDLATIGAVYLALIMIGKISNK